MSIILFNKMKNYKMGIGDWGLGIGDWGLGPIPNPQEEQKAQEELGK